MQLRGPLRLAGELGVQGLFNTVAPGQLVYVTDQLSNRRFLVDTGAAYSILPHHSSGQPTGPPLAGPVGRPLACWGEKPEYLVLDGCRFKWTFLLAAVHCPIIGVAGSSSSCGPLQQQAAGLVYVKCAIPKENSGG